MPVYRQTILPRNPDPRLDLEHAIASRQLMKIIHDGLYTPPRSVKNTLKMYSFLDEIERQHDRIAYHHRRMQKEMYKFQDMRRHFRDLVLETTLLVADGPLLDIISGVPIPTVIDLTDDIASSSSPSPPAPTNTPTDSPPGLPSPLEPGQIPCDAPLSHSRRAPNPCVIFGPHDTCGHEPGSHNWDLDAARCSQYVCPYCIEPAPGHFPKDCTSLDPEFRY